MATGYTTSAVTLPAGPVATQLFMGRPSRTCLIIAAAVSGVTFVAEGQSNFNSRIFARLPAGTTMVMPERDYGPLISGEIWVSNTVGSTLINGAEIYPIPKARR